MRKLILSVVILVSIFGGNCAMARPLSEMLGSPEPVITCYSGPDGKIVCY